MKKNFIVTKIAASIFLLGNKFVDHIGRLTKKNVKTKNNKLQNNIGSLDLCMI